MERADCTACGSPRVGFTPDHPTPLAAPQGVGHLVASALVPGLGHLLLGHHGSGTARLLLWTLWAGGALLTLLAAGVTGATVVLGSAAVGLWALSLLDLGRLAEGRPQVLSARSLAWSVVGVTTLLVLTGLASTAGTRT